MKEYVYGGSNRQEQYFGLDFCSARNVIECAFGQLKAIRKASARRVRMAIDYDRDFQPPTATSRYLSNSNEAKGKRVRSVLTRYFDP